MKLKQNQQLFDLLEQKYLTFSQADFIENDPILIPHRFSKKEDIEISGFLAAIIAWGQRKTIINNAKRILTIMDNAPFDFICNHQETDLIKTKGFVHRTFNADDLMYFFSALKRIYLKHGGLETVFSINPSDVMADRLSKFKKLFFDQEHLKRTEKHLADPLKGSTAKRLNMYLRWMVRTDKEGIDFGIWRKIETKHLMLPLDIHTSKVGRSLGLLNRKQNDWKAVEEVTANLRTFDAIDPVKYDFALFGMGVNGQL